MQPPIMTKDLVLCTAVTLLIFITNAACECLNAATSEGYTTLQNGQMACAPLQSGETEDDKGKKFVICDNGNVVVQMCSAGLRFDVRLNICNWPAQATCQFSGGTSGASVTTRTTTTATTKPTTTTNPTTTTKLVNTTSSSRTPPPPSTSQTPPRPPTSQTPPVGPCSVTNCKLPNCFCYGHSPSNVPTADLPMFVMLTFDDHVSTVYYNNYFRALMVDNDFNLRNPSGCRPKFAFYVNHDNTDYTKVKALWDAGNEIGSHTYHHRLPQGDKDSDYPEMVDEIQGLKDEVLRATGNKTLVDSIRGFRAPYLRVAGDVQFNVLRDYGFVYDTSILNINLLQGKVPDWPFTLDFVLRECISPPCPTKPYPGLWEVPLNGWIGDDQNGCSMPDTCVVGTNSWLASEQQWYDYYKRNFETYFYPVKVPMPIFIHGTLFDNFPRSYPALTRWLQNTLLTRSDVWLVNPGSVIKWMQSPLSNSDMIAQKWGC